MGMIPPIPPIPPVKIVSLLLSVVDLVSKMFSKIAKKGSQEKPLTDKSSAEDVIRMHDIFNDFKRAADAEAIKVEKQALQEIDAYIEELLFTLNSQSTIFDKYNIRLIRFENKLDRLKNRLEGVIQREISVRVSLNYPECKSIIQMMAGTKKEERLEQYLQTVIQDALVIMSTNITEVMTEMEDSFEELLLQHIEQAEKQVIAQKGLLHSVEQDGKGFLLTQQELQAKALLLIYNCDIVKSLVREVD